MFLLSIFFLTVKAYSILHCRRRHYRNSPTYAMITRTQNTGNKPTNESLVLVRDATWRKQMIHDLPISAHQYSLDSGVTEWT